MITVARPSNTKYDLHNPSAEYPTVVDSAHCDHCIRRALPCGVKEDGRACYQCMPAAMSFQSAVVHVPYPAHPQPKPAIASRHLLGHPNCNCLGRMRYGSLANGRLAAPVWHHSNRNLVAKVSDLNFISWCTECLTSFRWSGDSHTKMVGQKVPMRSESALG